MCETNTKCDPAVAQRCYANIREQLEKCSVQTLQMLVQDMPLLLQNQNFRVFESIAKQHGIFIGASPYDQKEASSAAADLKSQLSQKPPEEQKESQAQSQGNEVLALAAAFDQYAAIQESVDTCDDQPLHFDNPEAMAATVTPRRSGMLTRSARRQQNQRKKMGLF